MESNSGFLDVLVTSSINSFGTQRRFPLDITVSELKQRLELVTGASMNTMELQMLDDKKEFIVKLTDNHALLSSFSLDGAKELYVVDNSCRAGEFEDVSQVQKYQISEEAYSKRSLNVRDFKEKMKISSGGDQTNNEKKLKEEEALANKIAVGDRCEVKIAGKDSRRGTVMFVGKTDFKPGHWVGIKYDEPLGKNDGSVGGKRYFECEPKYGGFVKPNDVTVGDFPELTYDDIDEL